MRNEFRRAWATALLMTGVFAGRGAVGAEAVAEAGPVRWSARGGGSGFLDEAWLDANGDGQFSEAERIVALSDGRPRLLATLAAPPDAPLSPVPTGVRLGWQRLPATLTVERVDTLAAGRRGVRTSGRLTYPNDAAAGTFAATLYAVETPGALLADLELSWSKLPPGARLVEAGFELETVFDPKEITAALHPAQGVNAGGRFGWGRHQGAGLPVRPAASGGSSLPYPTGGFIQRYSLWLREDAGFGRAIHGNGVDSKSFQSVFGDIELEWFRFGDGRRTAAAAMRGMAEMAPKMFGTLPRNPKSLFVWVWPPMTDGLFLEQGKAYTAANMAFLFLSDAANSGSVPDRIESLRETLPAMTGNLRWPAGEPPLALPAPDTAWLEAGDEADVLPAADPDAQGNRIPILLSGLGSSPLAGAVALRCGVPFPVGALASADAVRLLGLDGREIPAQTERTAVWPDGSVKWLLLDFVAPQALGPTGLVGHLEWGEGVAQKAAPERPVSVARAEDGSVTVDTGVLRFTAAPGPGGFLHAVDFDANGDGRYGADERIVNPPEPGERRAHFIYAHHGAPENYLSQSLDVPGFAEQAETTVETVTVEAAGPVRATLRLDGRHRHPRLEPKPEGAEDGAPFTVWLTTQAGSSSVHVTHDFIVEGAFDGSRQIAGIGLSLRMNLAGERRILLEGADPAKPIALTLREGEEFANVQERLDRARALVFGKAAWRAGEVRTLAVGRSASDWVSVADGRRGVTVGLKDMWELNPQAIHLGARDVAVWFWPPHGAPWDTRGGAPGSRPSNSHGRFRGLSRVHEAVFHFHATNADVASLRGRARVVTRPAFARASTKWTASTLALGLLHPYDPDRFPAAEALQRHSFLRGRDDLILRRRIADTQPGIATYGSAGSTESYTQYALATSAARTGWPGQYRAALAKCRFDMGMAFRRGARPGPAPNHPSDWANSTYRAGGDSGSRGGQIMYYLTGDEPLRVFSDERARSFMNPKGLAAWTEHAQGRGLGRLFGMYGRSEWGHLLWAWERDGQGDPATAVANVFAAAARGALAGGLRGDIDCGTGNIVGEIYAHGREAAILEFARAVAADRLGRDAEIRGQKGTTTLPALAFWESGERGYLSATRTALDKPVLGGAFSHYTMYATMRIQMSMAAMARHGVFEK